MSDTRSRTVADAAAEYWHVPIIPEDDDPQPEPNPVATCRHCGCRPCDCEAEAAANAILAMVRR